jgi:cbb3-type cytochrome oxidase cytochrome c subunit
MKGFVPLMLGIFGTFAFSWAGLIMIPNAQIGHLQPQMDEEGGDAYPVPKSGMAERGRKVYMANGCVYCHSQQIRPDYVASDIERKWGQRRSAPRDYIFERPSLLGKMRMGPDLSNMGRRAPADDANAPAPDATNTTTGAPSAPAPAGATASAAATPASAPAGPSGSPAPAATRSDAPAPGGSPAAPVAPPAGQASPAPATAAQTASGAVAPTTNIAGNDPERVPLQYSAAWHHRHLYNPRSVVPDSIMPAFRFLYEKRKVGGERAANAVNLTGPSNEREQDEIVPTYDAECLVAYLMSLDQSHALKEVKSNTPASPPAPGKAAK